MRRFTNWTVAVLLFVLGTQSGSAEVAVDPTGPRLAGTGSAAEVEAGSQGAAPAVRVPKAPTWGTDQAAKGAPAEEHFRAGEQLARTLTLVTGVPISPLLGVASLGTLRWLKTPESLRPALPWYTSPWFWGIGFAVVLLFTFNTIIGDAVPGLAKPMEFVEVIENKASGVVAAPVLLLEVSRSLGSAGILEASGSTGNLGASGLALIAQTSVLNWNVLGRSAVLVLALAAAAVVFLAFHAFQVLIAIAPFPFVGMLLRTARMSILAVVAGASLIHPLLGAVVSLGVLLIAALVAAWSFRMTVYGSVLAWDVVTWRVGSADPKHDELRAFATRGMGGPPTRTYGRLERSADNRWCFCWRPWLLLSPRELDLGRDVDLAVLRGVFSPRLIRTGNRNGVVVARFPPRFRGLEDRLAVRLGTTDVRDGLTLRGFRLAWQWFRELVTGRETVAPPASAPDSAA